MLALHHTAPPSPSSKFHANLSWHGYCILLYWHGYCKDYIIENILRKFDSECRGWCHSEHLLNYLIGIEFVAISGLLQVVNN